LSDQNSRSPFPPPASAVHAQRRYPGGPRREASDRVTLRATVHDNPGQSHEVVGWTLNISRGGARLVVEDTLAVGQAWELWVNEATSSRPIRVVWVRDEAGGQIVGIQYMDCVGTIPPFDDITE
jgi:hypothetical protein